MITIRTRRKRKTINNWLRSIPQGIVNGGAVGRLDKYFVAAMSYEIFKNIYKAYRYKMLGAFDEFGDKWLPLSKSTVASRPIGLVQRARLGVTGKRTRGFLTPAQDRRWAQLYVEFGGGSMARGYADKWIDSRAAAQAWYQLKKEGAKTKKDLLGNRIVRILYVTGKLMNSLTPGQYNGTHYGKRKGQVYDRRPGELTLGTEVPYAAKQHKRRPLIPPAENSVVFVRRGVYEGTLAVTAKIMERMR